MAIYCFTLSALAGLGILTERKKKLTEVYMGGAFLLLVFVSSFRYAIGFDYFSYRTIYDLVSGWSFGEIMQFYWMEPLYFILCKICSLAGCSYPVFLLIINVFLMAASIHFIYRCSKLPWVSVFLFVCLQFLAHDMNLIRQSIAAAFFLLAYPSLKDRKLLPYTLLILTGGLFHNSLLFVYPLYFLLPKKISRNCLICLAGLTITVYVLFDPLFLLIRPFLPLKYAAYLGGYFWNPNGFSFVVLPALYCLMIYLFRNRIKHPLHQTIYVNSALYCCIINLFITKHFILERFAVYPFLLSLLAIPEIICSYQESESAGRSTPIFLDKKEGGRKPVLTYRRTLLLFLIFGMIYFTFAAINGYHHVYPYTSLLDKSSSTPY